MSWQAYIDTSLCGSGNVDRAAIYTNNLKIIADETQALSSWAHSDKFEASRDELKAILEGFKPENREAIQGNGFKVNGEKYMVIFADDDTLRGKKGKEGIVVIRTKLALVLAHHPDTVITQSCVSTVEALGDYLKAQNC